MAKGVGSLRTASKGTLSEVMKARIRELHYLHRIIKLALQCHSISHRIVLLLLQSAVITAAVLHAVMSCNPS
jgi:hypothetical protein